MTDLFAPSAPAPTDIPIVNGRYMVPMPGAATPKSYMRVTNFIGVMENTYTLTEWQLRQVAIGLAKRPDLVLRVHAAPDPATPLGKQAIQQIATEAKTAAGADIKRDSGTAWHLIVERYHAEGHTPEGIDAAIMKAYVDAVRPLRFLALEQYVCIDELKVAGRFDALVEHVAFPGVPLIADLKSGSMTYAANKTGMQLGCYAWGKLVLPDGARLEHGASKQRGIVIDFNAEAKTVELRWVDIGAAARGLGLARQVHDWRKIKDFWVDLPTASDL